MKKFKERIYNSYVSTHNGILYGENSLMKISRHFPAWKYYYIRHFPTDKSVRILDIGCGDGNFVYMLHQLGYPNANGIDISREQIESGQKMGINNLVCEDLIAYLSNSQHKFDVIIARDVIEHFERDEVFEIFDLVSARLNANGRFIVQVPNGQGIYYTSIFFGDYTHEMAYTASSINQIILNTGFSRSQCFPVGPAPVSMFAKIRSVLWKIKVARLKFWKMVETGNGSGIFTQNLIAVIYK